MPEDPVVKHKAEERCELPFPANQMNENGHAFKGQGENAVGKNDCEIRTDRRDPRCYD